MFNVHSLLLSSKEIKRKTWKIMEINNIIDTINKKKTMKQ